MTDDIHNDLLFFNMQMEDQNDADDIFFEDDGEAEMATADFDSDLDDDNDRDPRLVGERGVNC